MEIILAGYNLDTEVIKELTQGKERFDATPETISASYARISRDPRPVNELRRLAREEVEKSRKSNRNIIFKMGHHSVAEHAVFNFDILKVSRLVIEEIEKFRLCSYTEKSQRYITLENDFVIPEELKGTALEKDFVQIVRDQNKFYHQLYEKLKEYVFKKHADLAQDLKQHNTLDGWAKEDARYITSLATEGQLGQTINARNLELLFRRFASHPFKEVQKVGEEIFKKVEKVAPSIILFTAANALDQKTYPELEEMVKGKWGKPLGFARGEGKGKRGKEISLVNSTRKADEVTIASLLHTVSQESYDKCLKWVKKMNTDEKMEVVKAACRHMEFFDSTLREFEHVNLTYDLVISASCFAQLKRHRMATITSQKYDPALGVTIPPSIIDVGMERNFMKVIRKTEAVYGKIKKELPLVAQYVLTNAHRKRVLLGVNARELYHISRLREDSHAQWDIQRCSTEMTTQAKKVMPLTMLLVGGKDNYTNIYKDVFGKPPKITEIPTL